MRKTTTFERKVVAKLKQNQKSKAYSRAQAESHKLAKDTFNGALMQNSERGRRTALREREIVNSNRVPFVLRVELPSARDASPPAKGHFNHTSRDKRMSALRK